MYIDERKVTLELAARRRDPVLRAKAVDFLGGFLPEGWPQEPIAALPRHVASCRYEDIAFAATASKLGLAPWWPTYLKDKFVTSNPDKRNFVAFRTDGNSNHLVKIKLVKEMNDLEQGKACLGEIVTNRLDDSGQPLQLQEVHTRMRRQVFPHLADHHFDISAWFSAQALRNGATPQQRNLAPFYYPASLAMFILHGVMFEDYHGGPNAANLARFVEGLVEPALKILEREIGISPLIVQFPWQQGFDLYPSQVLKVL